jgi:recombination protein RecA
MLLARADLESLLRDRKLVPPVALRPNTDEQAAAPTGVSALDAALSGGFPRGQLSEIVGARSSGRTSVLLQLVAQATVRRELVALVDVLDMFDVASAKDAGVDFDRLLWIRGQVLLDAGPCREMNQRALDRAIKALTLVLQAGNFGLVAFDAAEAPPRALERLPFTTWRRLQRIIEGSQTVCVLAGDRPIARSAGGITVRLKRAEERPRPRRPEDEQIRGDAGGVRVDDRLFHGLDLGVEIVRAHAHRQEAAAAPLSTYAVQP